ncbi:MAG: rRNA maturation RNase YbeY [Opitutaceae bacterium]|nr:rRNA maturation RNase YbeY [Opitutaceae bacterium]
MKTPPTAPRVVAIANHHPRLRLDRRAIARAIHLLDAEFRQSKIENRKSKIPAGELSLVFLTDDALARLHADFLDDPSPTDVITFEGDLLAGTAGEICVSADMAAAAAKKHRHTFARELTLYLVHGWLHLAGYDDLEPRKKRAMRRAEARAMELLGRRRSLPRFTLQP